MAETRLHCLETVDSTNSEAWRAVAREGRAADGLVVVAAGQTAGRGQQGHPWFSQLGAGLYMSTLDFPLDLPATEVPRLAALGAEAVLAALAHLGCCPASAVVKPPNDILVDGRKLCGVLIETRLTAPGPGHDAMVEAVVAGFGINLHHGPDDFPADLRSTATSLAQLGCPVPTLQILAVALAREWRHRLSALTEEQPLHASPDVLFHHSHAPHLAAAKPTT